MSGNGSLTGSEFKTGGVLPDQKVTNTEGNNSKYESNQIGGKKRRRMNSLRSVRTYGNVNTLKLRGGSKKSRKTHKNRRHRKTKKWFKLWPF
jgi:hypothetical protein